MVISTTRRHKISEKGSKIAEKETIYISIMAEAVDGSLSRSV